MVRHKHCHVCKRLIGPAQTSYIATRQEVTMDGARTVKEPACPTCVKAFRDNQENEA